MERIEFFLGPVLKGKVPLSVGEWEELIELRVSGNAHLDFVWGEPMSIPGFAQSLLTTLSDRRWVLRSSFFDWDNFNILRSNPAVTRCELVVMRFMSPDAGGWCGEAGFVDRVKWIHRAGYQIRIQTIKPFTEYTLHRLQGSEVDLGPDAFQVVSSFPVEEARLVGKEPYLSRGRRKCPGDLQVIGPAGDFFPCPLACLFGMYRYGNIKAGAFVRERQESCELACPFKVDNYGRVDISGKN